MQKARRRGDPGQLRQPYHLTPSRNRQVTAMMGPGHLDQGLTLDVTGTNAFKMICRPDPRWPRQCQQPR